MAETRTDDGNATGALSREVALRIAKAARALPDVDVRLLLRLLDSELKGTLTELSLQALTVKKLKHALAEADVSATRRQVEESLALLRGDGEETDASIPSPEPFEAASWPASVRLAVASNSGDMADGHFGSCTRFLIYQVATGRHQLVDVRPAFGGDTSSATDKNDHRVELVRDCQLLLSASIGGPAAAKVVKAGVFPIKLGAGRSGEQVASDLAERLKNNPPPWLARAMNGSPPATGGEDHAAE